MFCRRGWGRDDARIRRVEERGGRSRARYCRAALPPHSRRGFTMIELLVVVVLIALLSAAAIPVFDGGLDTARGRASLDRITQLMSLCSSMAASDGQPYRLLINQERGAFQVMFEENPLENPGEFAALLMSDMSACELDESIIISDWKIESHDPESNELPYIEFRPDGTADKAQLILESQRGDQWTVTVSPMTGALRVYDYNLDEKEEEQAL